MDDMLIKTMYDTEQATPCPYCGNTFLVWSDKPEWDVDDNYCFMHCTAKEVFQYLKIISV